MTAWQAGRKQRGNGSADRRKELTGLFTVRRTERQKNLRFNGA